MGSLRDWSLVVESLGHSTRRRLVMWELILQVALVLFALFLIKSVYSGMRESSRVQQGIATADLTPPAQVSPFPSPSSGLEFLFLQVVIYIFDCVPWSAQFPSLNSP